MGQKSLVELLSRTKRKYEAIDLTNDDVGIQDCDGKYGAKANKLVKCEENGLQVEGLEEEFKSEVPKVKENVEIPNDSKTLEPQALNDFDSIPCPVCQLNISKLSLSNRENHVELCLLQPNTHKLIIKPSPEKSKIPSPKNLPKKESKPKPRTKPIPDFKILTFKNNYKIIVDGFQFMDHSDINQYFLSHYHSDHYIGLGKKWNQGKILTSITTANLLRNIMKIPNELIIGIPLEVNYKIHENIDLILYDANHCPGGVIFLFQEYNSKGEIIKRILHTGDFRVSYNHIEKFNKLYIDEIYLDTTYLNPVYTFMPQHQVVFKSSEFINKIINQIIKKNSILNYFKSNNDYLIIIGAYSIGKEKLYINLAKKINSKILITKERYKMLNCIDGFEDLNIFQTQDFESTCKIQIVSINKLTDLSFLSKFQNKKIIKIKPTGWSFNTFKRPNSNLKNLSPSQIITKTITTNDEINFENQLLIQFENSSSLNIPYSEHSSFKELCIFGTSLSWGKIIPTVNVTNPTFNEWFELWKDQNCSKKFIKDYYNQ